MTSHINAAAAGRPAQSDDEVFTAILGSILRQPSMSRRQQLLLSLWAASGKIDALFASPPAFSSKNVNSNGLTSCVIDADTESEGDEPLSLPSSASAAPSAASAAGGGGGEEGSRFSPELLLIGDALCELTSKVLVSLVGLLKSLHEHHQQQQQQGIGNSSETPPPPMAPFLDFLFALSAHLLRTKVARTDKQQKKGNYSSGTAVSPIAAHLAVMNAKVVSHCRSFFQREFINLIDVPSASQTTGAGAAEGGGGSAAANPHPYTLIIERGNVCKGTASVVFVISILAALNSAPSFSSTAAAASGRGGGSSSGSGSSFFGPKTLTKTIELLTRFLASPPPNTNLFGVLKRESQHPSEILLQRVDTSEHYAAASLAAIKALKDLFLLSSDSTAAAANGKGRKKTCAASSATLFPSIAGSAWRHLPPLTTLSGYSHFGFGGSHSSANDSPSQMMTLALTQGGVTFCGATTAGEVTAADGGAFGTPQQQQQIIVSAAESADAFFLNIVVRQKLFGWLLPLLATGVQSRIASEASGLFSQQLSGRNSSAAASADNTATNSCTSSADALTQQVFQAECANVIEANTMLWVLDACCWAVEDGLAGLIPSTSSSPSSSSSSNDVAASTLVFLRARAVPVLSLLLDVCRSSLLHLSDVSAATVVPITVIPAFVGRVARCVAALATPSSVNVAFAGLEEGIRKFVDGLAAVGAVTNEKSSRSRRNSTTNQTAMASTASAEVSTLISAILETSEHGYVASGTTGHHHDPNASTNNPRGVVTHGSNDSSSSPSVSSALILGAVDPFALGEQSNVSMATLVSRLMKREGPNGGGSPLWPTSLWGGMGEDPTRQSSGAVGFVGAGQQQQTTAACPVGQLIANLLTDVRNSHASASPQNSAALSSTALSSALPIGAQQLSLVGSLILSESAASYLAPPSGRLQQQSANSSLSPAQQQHITAAATSRRHSVHTAIFTSTAQPLAALTNSYTVCHYLRAALVAAPAAVAPSSSSAAAACSDLIIEYVCHPSVTARLALPRRVADGVAEWRRRNNTNNGNATNGGNAAASMLAAAAAAAANDNLLCRSSTEIPNSRDCSAQQQQQQQQPPKRNSFELPPMMTSASAAASTAPSRRMSLNLSIVGGGNASSLSMSRPSERFDMTAVHSALLSNTNNSNTNGGGIGGGATPALPPPPHPIQFAGGSGDVRSTMMHVDIPPITSASCNPHQYGGGGVAETLVACGGGGAIAGAFSDATMDGLSPASPFHSTAAATPHAGRGGGQQRHHLAGDGGEETQQWEGNAGGRNNDDEEDDANDNVAGDDVMFVASPLRRQKRGAAGAVSGHQRVVENSLFHQQQPLQQHQQQQQQMYGSLSGSSTANLLSAAQPQNAPVNTTLLVNHNSSIASLHNNSTVLAPHSTDQQQQQQQPRTAAASFAAAGTGSLSASGSLVGCQPMAAPHHNVVATNGAGGGSTPLLAGTIAGLEQMLSSLRHHSADHSALLAALAESQGNAHRLAEENAQLRRNFQREIAAARQDKEVLKEQLAATKKEALEASAHFAGEMMAAMKRLEERNRLVAELEAQNRALTNRVKRQEAKTMQMLSMLNSE